MTRSDVRQQNAERRLRHAGYWDHNGQRVSPASRGVSWLVWTVLAGCVILIVSGAL